MVKEKAKGIDKRLIFSSRKNLKEGGKKKKKKGKLSVKNCNCLYVYLAWLKARIQI